MQKSIDDRIFRSQADDYKFSFIPNANSALQLPRTPAFTFGLYSKISPLIKLTSIPVKYVINTDFEYLSEHRSD